jgi:hypothetical protein
VTLRELMVDAVGLDDPFVCVVSALQVLRSAALGETATAEASFGALAMWLRHYRELTPESVKRWLDDLGELADVDIPNKVVLEALDEGD